MDVDEGRRYVRAVWPSAQTAYDEYVSNGYHPYSAAARALLDHGVSWSHTEALEAAGLEEDY